MEEIIQIIEDKINKLNEDKEGKKRLEELKQKVISFLDNPDAIVDNQDEFKFIFSEEDRNTLEAIISLCGLYNYKESQIINALNSLKEMVDKKVSSIDEEINRIQDNINTSVDEYNRLLDILINYDEDTYVSIDDLLKIKEIVGESEELLKLYFIVAINNSEIEIKQINEQNEEESALSRDVVEDLDNSRAIINTTVQEMVDEVNKKNEYLVQINSFISNIGYRDLDEELYNLVLPIMLSAKDILEDEKEKLFIDCVEEDGNLETMNLFEGNELKLLVARELLFAYEDNNIDKVRDILNIYKSNKSIDIKDFLALEGLRDYASILFKLEEKYNIKDGINSVEGVSYEDVLTDGLSQTLQNDIYLLKITYKDILELLNERKMTDEVRTILDKLMNRIINILEKQDSVIDNNQDDNKTDNIKENLIGKENCVVFYDIDEFHKSYENLMKDHYELANDMQEEIKSKIECLKDRPLLDLITNESVAHNIHRDRNKRNKEEILALKDGKTRLSFKVLEGIKIKDDTGKEYPVIMIIHVCYGWTDKYTKNYNLSEALTIFDRYQAKAKIKDERTGRTTRAIINTRCEEWSEILSSESNADGLSEKAIEKLSESVEEMKKLETRLHHNKDMETAQDLLDSQTEENKSNTIQEDEELGGKTYEKQ